MLDEASGRKVDLNSNLIFISKRETGPFFLRDLETMFILTTFSDLVQIPPHEFYKRDHDEVEDKINEKFSNKVVQKIGLCVCMYDLLSSSDGVVAHGTGDLGVQVEFRMIVFRPFKGEVLSGKIIAQSAKGLQVSTEFFDDIYVPPQLLFANSTFNEEERVWIWKNEDAGDFYYDVGDVVRLRVESEEWQDQAPRGPQKAMDGEDVDERSMPYSITASMAEAGLGPTYWW